MKSQITHSAGGSMFAGPEAVDVFRCTVIASALELYAKTGMKANRSYTPTNMLNAAHQITGKRFKRGQYLEAAKAIRAVAAKQRAAIPEVDERTGEFNEAAAREKLAQQARWPFPEPRA